MLDVITIIAVVFVVAVFVINQYYQLYFLYKAPYFGLLTNYKCYLDHTNRPLKFFFHDRNLEICAIRLRLAVGYPTNYSCQESALLASSGRAEITQPPTGRGRELANTCPLR